MTLTKLKWKSIKDTMIPSLINATMQSRSPDHSGNGDPSSSHNGSSISGDSVVSSVYTCFA